VPMSRFTCMSMETFSRCESLLPQTTSHTSGCVM